MLPTFEKARTKTDAVLAHLLAGRSITQMEAITEYSLFRLPVIIATLREEGWPVLTEMRKSQNGTRYGRYTMPKYLTD